MPRSLTSVVEELARIMPPKDAPMFLLRDRRQQCRVKSPSRFDLYDMQASIDKLTAALDNCKGVADLEEKVDAFSDAVDTLSRTVVELTKVVEKLAERV